MKEREYEPETFREAVESGKVGVWLRGYLIWSLIFGVAIFFGWLYFQIFPPHEIPSVIDATAHVKEMWHKGDQAGAIAYYRPVADAGSPVAQFTMGVLYESATGKLHDDAQAAQWFQKSADQKYARAERELGVDYMLGTGVMQDNSKALKLFLAAAGQGNDDAQADLAHAYAHGELGLAQDSAQAIVWYRRAAAKGNIVAEINLSDLLFKNDPPDPPGAYRWASLAASSTVAGTQANIVAVANAASARAKLTPEQIADADAWVRNWKIGTQ